MRRRWQNWQRVIFADGDVHEKLLSSHFTEQTARWALKFRYARLDVWAWWNVMYPEWAIEDVQYEIRREGT